MRSSEKFRKASFECLFDFQMKEIGLPRSMVRAMAGEAEAKVQSQAKMAMSRGEAVANNKLVEAGDNLDVVSIHLRYLQTMMRISQPHVRAMLYLTY